MSWKEDAEGKVVDGLEGVEVGIGVLNEGGCGEEHV